MIEASVLEPEWAEMIEKKHRVIFIAEGILMYFSKEQVRKLLLVIEEQAIFESK